MLTEHERKIAIKAIQQKKYFLILSIASVVVGLSLAVYYSWETYAEPGFDVGIHFVLVVMILLNARQNLRQHRYARILETVFLCKSTAENKT